MNNKKFALSNMVLGLGILIIISMGILILARGALGDTKVYGYVTDSETSEAIDNADVDIYSDNYWNETDKEGYYEIILEEGGEYTLSVYKNDYYRHEEDFIILEEEERQIDVDLEKKSKLFGYVRDKDTNEPINRADVAVDGPDWEDDYTDKNGYYEMYIKDGDYDMRIDHEDYKRYKGEFSIGKGEEKQIDVELEPKPPENSMAYGYITDKKTGDPIEEIEVEIENDDDDYYHYTDEDGYYRIKLRKGDYTLVVNNYNYENKYNSYEAEISVGENEKIQINTKLEKKSKLFGYVTDSDTADTIEDARIRLEPENVFPEYPETDGDGYYEMFIEEGDYNFSVRYDDYNTYYEDILISKNEEKQIDVQLEPKPPKNSRIYGYINDMENNEPIENTYVRISNNDDSYVDYTDAEGYYNIKLSKGYFDIYISNKKYETYEDSISIDENEEMQINVQLNRKPKVYGNLTDLETGKAIYDARVKVSNKDYYFNDYTNSKGYYEIYIEHQQTYAINITHYEYNEYEETIIIEDDDKEKEAQLVSKHEEITKVYGYVKDKKTDEVIIDERVRVDKYNDNTEEYGYYEIMIQGGGDYTLKIWDDEYYEFEEDFSINKGEKKKIDIQLEKKSKLFGYVTDSKSNDPIEDARVRADGPDYDSEYSDEDGYYEMYIEAGDYDMRVTLNDYKDHESEFTITNSEEKKIDVELEKKPPKNSKVYGKVTKMDTGKELEDGNVRISNDDESYSMDTHENGRYSIKCRGGEYTIRISRNYNDYYEIYEEQIIINEDEQKELNIQLKRKPTFYGYVFDKLTNEPIDFARVRAYGQDGEYDYTDHDKDGYFYIGLIEGRYDVEVEYSIDEEKDEIGYYEYKDDFTMLNEDFKMNFYLEPLPPLNVRVSGYVKNDKSEPLEDVRIRINNDIGYYSDYTDENGYYEINIRAGSYLLSSYYDEFEGEDYYDYEEQLHIKDNDDIKLNIELKKKPEKNSKIKGKVSDTASGETLRNARIYVENKHDRFRVYSDNSGNYEVDVRKGKYFIEIDYYYKEDDYYFGYWNEIEIDDNDEKTVNIKLTKLPEKSSTIKGQIKDPYGNPIDNARISFWDWENKEVGEYDYTNEEGYYESEIYGGKFIMEVDPRDGISAPDVSKIEINDGETKTIDKVLEKIEDQMEIVFNFDDWKSGSGYVNKKFGDDRGKRFDIETDYGNGDGDLTDNEIEWYFEFLGEERGDNTVYDFYVDDSYFFIFNEENEIKNVKGDVTEHNNMEWKITFDFEIYKSSQADIKELIIKIDYDLMTNYHITLPDDYVIEYYEASSNVIISEESEIINIIPKDSGEEEEIIKIIVKKIYYDVEIEVDENEKTIEIGSSDIFMLTINNYGDGEDTYKLECLGDNKDWGDLEKTELTLENENFEEIELVMKIPDGTEKGQYIISVQVTSKNNNSVIYTLDLIINVIEPTQYKVKITSDKKEKKICEGEEIEFTLIIENIGELDDTYNLELNGDYPSWGEFERSKITLSTIPCCS